jgi:mono/diheme cytochrome c family protein
LYFRKWQESATGKRELRLATIETIIIPITLAAALILTGCNAERRKSDQELGLTPQQAAGRKLYDNYCDRCHEPYSSSDKQGPSLKGIFKKPYLSESGLPANDERVGEVIRLGRSKMRGFGDVLSPQQVQDLLSYLHTL